MPTYKTTVTQALDRLLSRWAALLNAVPASATLTLAPAGKPFTFVGGAPVSRLAVVSSADDEATVQASETLYYDTRTKTLWEKTGTTWNSRTYTGDHPVLRPQSLCYAPNHDQLYYLDQQLNLHQVNRSPTVGGT